MKKKKLHRELAKNYFALPNVIYQLGLSAGAIAVYGYLLYIENRETYQCHARKQKELRLMALPRNRPQDGQLVGTCKLSEPK